MTKIDSIRWTSREGHPGLAFNLDGKPAELFHEQKPSLLDLGILVLLPGETADRLTPIRIPADPKVGRHAEHLVECAVKSHQLMTEYRRLMAADSATFQAEAVKV